MGIIMPGVKLDTSVLDVRSIGPRFYQLLGKLGIKTTRDLLWYFPARYEDFSKIYEISDLEPGQHATIQGTVAEIKMLHSWRRGIAVIEAIIEDESGQIRAVWFNQPYIVNSLRTGRMANFSGKVSLSDDDIYLSHPAYELVGKRETRHTARLVPVYPETKGLTSKGLRFLIQPILGTVEAVKEWLPPEILREQRLPEINQALKDVHFPAKIEDALIAKKRFAFEDLYLLQLVNLKQKMRLAEEKSPAIKTDIEIVKSYLKELPFELTLSQKRSLWEIIKDIEKPHPMNRLLQGDVGSGKTVVAAIAAFIASQKKYQTAIMAPTEVLARQHFMTFKSLTAGTSSFHQPVIALLTSSESRVIYETDLETTVAKPELYKKIEAGEIDIVIGTHALIQKSIKFKKLGLVVVDEQHRFGVRQRAELSKERSVVPHLLSMSATPIPRTLMLTIFGDLDISLITEMPTGRKNIITKIVTPEERKNAYDFIREEVKKGRQVFVICPRIEPDKKDEAPVSFREFKNLELKSVKEEYKKLSEKVFPDLKVAMLHGQMKPTEKSSIMKAFASKDTDILVSTSVVEVGVDIPNATIMMIEGADRFGLAQLYQFRGRVGRGKHQSYCFLLTDSATQSTKSRLQAILKAGNGFELAEMDLKLRGPGEFLGNAQTGMPDIAMESLNDPELIKNSRDSAIETIRADKNLTKHPLLKERLSSFWKKIHFE